MNTMPLLTQSSLLAMSLTMIVLTFALEEVKRVPPGFVGMRGKKDVMESFIDVGKQDPGIMAISSMRGNADRIDQEDDLYEKRGYRMGFQGVRGKKMQNILDDGNGPMDDNNDYASDDKRIMDYVSSHGKREPDYMDMEGEKDSDDVWQGELDDLNKRSHKGFFGVRGKKVPNGFFGVRGKKGPAKSFFGVRGKKIPMAFQGKKDDDQDIDTLLHDLIGGMGANYRAKRLMENNIKKVPNGFIGMRGKRELLPITGQGIADDIENLDGRQ